MKNDRDEAIRRAFEAWITAPPFEASVERYGPGFAWPDDYRDIGVSLAWAAWREGRLAGLQEATDAALLAVPPAHTYASENADRYRAQDDARDAIIRRIKLL